MEIEITIKNYRCFPDSRPARIRLGKGFFALVGANNSGKSSLLKFFFEFRDLFHKLSVESGVRDRLLTGGVGDFKIANSVFDIAELFSNSNNRDLEIQVDFDCDRRSLGPVPNRIVVNIPRGTNTWKGTLYIGGSAINPKGTIGRVSLLLCLCLVVLPSILLYCLVVMFDPANLHAKCCEHLIGFPLYYVRP